MSEISTHGLICDFGKHRGTPWTRIPANYLLWMVNGQGVNETIKRNRPIAEAELKRRGTTLPKVDISGHAIDRASQQCLDFWRAATRDGEDQGIHSWLVEQAEKALEEKNLDAQGRYLFGRMVFAFEMDGVWPVLKTVMRAKS